MNNINITVQLSQEDRTILTTIWSTQMDILRALDPEGRWAKQEAPQANVAPVDAPANAPWPEPEAVEEAAQDPAPGSKELQLLVQKLCTPTSPCRVAAKAIVLEYAPKVSDIADDKVVEAYNRLKALEVQA